MEQRRLKRREVSEVSTPVDQLLASHYGQLLQWGSVLTRGDAGKTEEIVQELCLYFTLTQPDLTSVVNLDGYLYTSLRHIYLSSLARSSREALRFVSMAEFDSFDSALKNNSAADPLQTQNDLRRICSYTVWRKEFSKSASYFILHFFHGYTRREIAEMACLPIAAIYNKLKVARSEVTSYLEEPGKLRIVNRDLPPQPRLAWSLLSAPELFNELRKSILQARTNGCLEQQLLAHYRAAAPKPLSCCLLAHIVSCERCLSIVDRHFRRPTLQDREPLDCFGSSGDGSNSGSDGSSGTSQKAQKEMLAVLRRWDNVREHRPRTLSIAVNGHIIAFHDVLAEHSKLSARIENPEAVDFVEVFSEQDVRFALLSIGELPPGGAPVRTERVELSDDRWLELSLAFDGQGLNGQVAYFDPALASVVVEEEREEPAAQAATAADDSWFAAGFRWLLATMTPSSAFAWTVILAVVFAGAGYFALHHPAKSTAAAKILDESVKTEAEALRGETEHQTLRIEEVSSSGKVLQQGTVDLWKDGNGDRYLRRLYDAQHRVLAAEWRNKSGEHNSRRNSDGKNSPGATRSAVMSEFWDQDLSANAFSTLAGQGVRVHPVKEGYELVTDGPITGHPQLMSATLVLTHQLRPIRVTLRVHAGSNTHELRFVQASYERRPSASVPDSTFDPASYTGAREFHSEIHSPKMPVTEGTAPLLAELQIAVLYQLNQLGADTAEPIEVKRADDGTLRVSGAISDNTLKARIAARLRALPNHRLLDLRLFSSREFPMHTAHASQRPAARMYEIDQAGSVADSLLRKHFQARGLAGDQLDSAVVTFSHNTLEHSQRALQHAYALDRLGRALSTSELQSVSLASQQQWTEMVHEHASDLEQQLMALHGQLTELSTSAPVLPNADSGSAPIANPLQFSQSAARLLLQIQELNRRVSYIFAPGSAAEGQTSQDDSVDAILNVMPVQQARKINSFAIELSSSPMPPAAAQPSDGPNDGNRQRTPDGPR
jgi:DNA-directed RNA polymerase specialized sigma24 family protein